MKTKKAQILTTIVLSIVICFSQISPAFAAEIKDAWNNWKTVRVSCGINKSLYLDKNGHAQGYCSDYLSELSDINHWNIEYVEGSWNDSVQNLYDKKIDLLFPTQMTDERKETMGFSTSIGGYQPIVLYAKGSSELCYDDFAGFDGARIAVSKGTSNETALKAYANQNGFSYKTVYLNTVEEKIEALQNGTVDLIVFSTLNDVDNGKVVAMIDYLPFYYCTDKGNEALLKELNYGMNQMLIRHPDTVQNVFYSFMNRNVSFAYTKNEQSAIDTQGSITVGIYKDTAPLFDVEKDGEYVGIYVDLIKRIEKLSGLKIDIKALDRKEYAFDCLDKGTVDYILGSSDQALKYSNKDGYDESEGVMDYYTIEITRSNYSLNTSDNMVFALTNGRKYWEPIIEDKYPHATIVYCESSKDCLNAVKNGKADVTALNTWEFNYQSKNRKFENLIEWDNTRTLSQTVFISLDSKDDIISSIIDKSIEQISNEEKEATITANLNVAYDSYDLSDRIYEMRNVIIIAGVVALILLVSFSVYLVMRKKAITELEQKNSQLESANESKNIFLSRMSHELRTPLNAINGYATVLRQSLDEKDGFDENIIRSHIDSILRATKYQLSIISDLLDIQRIETGNMEIMPTEIDIHHYMENIVEMIQPEAEEKNIHFSYEHINSTNGKYLIDGIRFQQVILNLLHNAVKFTANGGTVKLTSEVIDQDESSNTLKFVVSDNGIGMSDNFQENYLFHRFAQEYKGTTSPYEGCGTGLAISREIMHLMGGEITCRSKQGVGSSFTVILVAKHIDKQQNRTKLLPVEEYDFGGMNVLLCEDNKMNQDIEKRLLQRVNCNVEIADDGKIALNKFIKSSVNHYSLILMDIRMPNMDGLEATKAIRGLDRDDAKNIPIVAVSANAFAEDVEKSIKSGMNSHLSKPVDTQKFYKTIKDLMN